MGCRTRCPLSLALSRNNCYADGKRDPHPRGRRSRPRLSGEGRNRDNLSLIPLLWDFAGERGRCEGAQELQKTSYLPSVSGNPTRARRFVDRNIIIT